MSRTGREHEDKSQVIQSFPEIAHWDDQCDIIGISVDSANFTTANINQITVNDITVTGTVVMASGEINLGDVSTVHIGGGQGGQVLTTNGLGQLSWRATTTGNGNGTVTSVGIASSTLSVTNSPVTTSGIITVDMSPTGVTPGNYLNTNITVDSWGRIVSASNGICGNGTVTQVDIQGGQGITVEGSPITTAGTITISNDGVHSVVAGKNITVSGDSNNPIISSVVEPNHVRYHSSDMTATESAIGDTSVYLIGNVAPNYTVGDKIIWDSIPDVEFTIQSVQNTKPSASGFETEDLGIGWNHPFIRIIGTDVLPYIPDGSKISLKSVDPNRPSPMWDNNQYLEIGNGHVVDNYYNVPYATQYDSLNSQTFSGYGVCDIYVAFPQGRCTLQFSEALPANLPANSKFTVLKAYRDIQFSDDFVVSVTNGILQIGLKHT